MGCSLSAIVRQSVAQLYECRSQRLRASTLKSGFGFRRACSRHSLTVPFAGPFSVATRLHHPKSQIEVSYFSVAVKESKLSHHIMGALYGR